jgi:hypothetical protein
MLFKVKNKDIISRLFPGKAFKERLCWQRVRTYSSSAILEFSEHKVPDIQHELKRGGTRPVYCPLM